MPAMPWERAVGDRRISDTQSVAEDESQTEWRTYWELFGVRTPLLRVGYITGVKRNQASVTRGASGPTGATNRIGYSYVVTRRLLQRGMPCSIWNLRVYRECVCNDAIGCWLYRESTTSAVPSTCNKLPPGSRFLIHSEQSFTCGGTSA